MARRRIILQATLSVQGRRVVAGDGHGARLLVKCLALSGLWRQFVLLLTATDYRSGERFHKESESAKKIRVT